MDNQKKEKETKPKLPLFELSDSTVESLLNAGVHFGHRTAKWNPAMRPYIYTSRGGIHIIDLVKSIDKMNEAIEAVYEYSKKGEVLFVGTKTQARDIVREAAVRSKAHFIINRWPGGFLTNYIAMRKSIKRMNDLIKGFQEGIENRTKKELMGMKKELERLNLLYGGVKQFNKRPACLVVVDVKKSRIAIREAHMMKIPVIAIVDTNASPENIDHVIPANDDSIKSIELVINRLADTILLSNEGKGVDYIPVDFEQVEDSIQNMTRILEERKSSQPAYQGQQRSKPGPRVVRVSREQSKKFAKSVGQKK